MLSNTLILHNVLYVHYFSYNPVSASKLTKDTSCCLIFISRFCFVQDLSTWKMIGVGEEKARLYHLLQKPLVCSSSVALSATQELDLWDSRLGHLSFPRLKVLNKSIPNFQATPN